MYVFSAKGATFTASMGASPQESECPGKPSAESPIHFSGSLLIPNIPLVEIDPMLAQQLAILLLEGASAMVLLLCLDVIQYGIELAQAHRKRAIPTLPEKAAIASVKRFDPFRGCFLHLLDEFSLGNSSR